MKMAELEQVIGDGDDIMFKTLTVQTFFVSLF